MTLVQQALGQGEAFNDVARRYSEDPSVGLNDGNWFIGQAKLSRRRSGVCSD